MLSKYWNFRTKLLLMFAAIIIVPLATVSILVDKNAKIGIEGQTQAGLSALVQSLERETISQITISEKIVESLSDLPVMKTNDFIGQRAVFSQIVKNNPQFMYIYTAYPDNPGLPSITPTTSLPADFDARKRPWYITGLASDKVDITDVYIDASSGAPIVTIIKSIRDVNNKAIGVIAADIGLGTLSDTVAKFKVGTQGYAYIVDKNGILIAHPDKELVKKQTNLADKIPFVKKALAGEQGFISYEADGSENVVSYKGAAELGWGVFVQQPSAEAFVALNTIHHDVIWTTIVAIILSLIIGALFAHRVASRVRKISQVADLVAKGDLTAKIDVSGQDEIGTLANSFNDMVANMRKILLEVTNTASTVNGSSQELTAHAQQAAATTETIANVIDHTIQIVEEGTEKQRHSVNSAQKAMLELSQAIGQISSGAQEQAVNVNRGAEMVAGVADGIQEVSQRMQVVEDAARTNMTKAEEGGQVVSATVQGMEEIKRVVFVAADGIKQLGNHSKQIGEIVEVIDDIAEQTNLLALNAAIEAARAGEHGKGFAVVADEVRKLAERSSKSTQEIRQLIQTIQKATDQAVGAMTQGTDEVERGSEKAHRAGVALQEIVEVARRSEGEIKAITSAIQAIRTQSQEVVQAIDNMAAITEENTASTEEMSAGSDNVLFTIENIATANTESSQAVRGVSNSSGELKQVAQQVAQAAQGLAGLSQNLQSLVSKFKI